MDASLDSQLERVLRDPAWDFLEKGELLIKQGACIPSDAGELLEDIFRGGNSMNSLKRLEWLIGHGARFDDVPSGPGILLLDTVVSKTFYRKGKFLLSHDIRFDDIPGGWVNLINIAAKSLGRFGGLDHILDKAPVDALIRVVEEISRCPEQSRSIIQGFYESDGDSGSMRWPSLSSPIPDAPIAMTITYLLKRLPDRTILKTQGNSIAASKTLLGARSPYFKHLFKSATVLGSNQTSFEMPKPYSVGTIQFIVSYAEVEPDQVDWSHFNLRGLLDILIAAHNFCMAELHSHAQCQIIRKGPQFISLLSAPEVIDQANQAKATILLHYCEEFLKLNIPQLAQHLAQSYKASNQGCSCG
jgi:hypothetical protein